MSESSSRGHWFDSACGIWFSEPSLKTSNFLILFLAPIMAPCNHNYGKNKQNRSSGRAKKQDQPAENVIALWQMSFLQCYMEELDRIYRENTIGPEFVKPADRAKELVQQLIRISSFRVTDQQFCAKADNCKEERFLGAFSNAKHLEDCDANGVMEKLSKMYARIADIVYQQVPSDRVAFVINTLKAQLQAEVEESDFTEIHDIGKLMCALLLLKAWKNCKNQTNCNLVNVLLKLKLELPEEATQTVQYPKRNISLEISVFQRLCATALRAKMSLQEMRDYFALLVRIKQTAPYCLTKDILKPFIDNLDVAYKDQVKPDISDSMSYINTLIELTGMQKECEKMLKELKGT